VSLQRRVSAAKVALMTMGAIAIEREFDAAAPVSRAQTDRDVERFNGVLAVAFAGLR